MQVPLSPDHPAGHSALPTKVPSAGGAGLGLQQERPVCKRPLHFPRNGVAANVALVVDAAAALSVASQP